MTDYGVDPESGLLVAVWRQAWGARAARVAAVPSKDASNYLCQTLTDFSMQVWRIYTHPHRAAGDPSRVNSEAWRRRRNRDALTESVAAAREVWSAAADSIAAPSLPVVAAARRVGHALVALRRDTGVDVMEPVAREMEYEVAALESAERGDFAGRASQALVLTRPVVLSSQLRVAWEALSADPLSADGHLRAIDPVAGCVVALTWLKGAALLAAEASGVHWTEVVREADNIEAAPWRTCTLALRLLDQGQTPSGVVLLLLGEAQAVGEGRIRDPLVLVQRVLEAQQQFAAHAERGVGLEAFLDRFTPLDPQRPAPDLLEDLLGGVRFCFALWQEFTTVAGHEDEMDQPLAELRRIFVGGLQEVVRTTDSLAE